MDSGKDVLIREAKALLRLADELDDGFRQAVFAITESKTVFLTGIGKPFIIAQKISASLASVGIMSFPIHPVDALHGDMGRIRRGDVLICLSNSGASHEVIALAEALSQHGVIRIAMTKAVSGPLASHCEIVLPLPDMGEADAEGLVPTVSTTLMLALGDALTVCVAQKCGFSLEKFAVNHPGGALGKATRPVGALMRPLGETAIVSQEATLLDALVAVNAVRSGAAFICEGKYHRLLGLFTDGDLRRTFAAKKDVSSTLVKDVMTQTPIAVHKSMSGGEALALMKKKKIDELPVINVNNELLGHLDIQDLV